MNILVNYLPIFKYSSNTDLLYPKNFKHLEIIDKTISVKFNNNFISNLLNYFFYNLRAIISKLYNKNIISLNRYSDQVIILPTQIKNVELIFSHGLFPKVISNIKRPIIYEDGFMTNEYCGVNDYAERVEEIMYKIKRYRMASLVLYNTQEAITRFCRLYPEFNHKIKYLPFLLPYLEPISEKTLNKKLFSTNKVKLLFVGKDGRRKGVFNLIKALYILKKKHPECFNLLEVNIITQTDLDLTFLPEVNYHKKLPREKILSLMRECHIFCLPTLKESYGLVLIEAMANGCAIITDNKQPRIEIFENGKAGILIEVTKVDSLVKAIQQVIYDRKLLTKLAFAARQRFIKEYSLESVHKKLVTYFKFVLNE